jgi:hypothetical protein
MRETVDPLPVATSPRCNGSCHEIQVMTIQLLHSVEDYLSVVLDGNPARLLLDNVAARVRPSPRSSSKTAFV